MEIEREDGAIQGCANGEQLGVAVASWDTNNNTSDIESMISYNGGIAAGASQVLVE